MSGTPTPSSSRSRSWRRYSIVLAANASSWTASPARASAIGVLRPASWSSACPLATSVVAVAAASSLVDAGPGALVQVVHDVLADVVDQRDAGRRRGSRDRGWGSGRRSTAPR